MDLEEKRNVLRKWISDAVADGWSLQPTYGPDEPVEFAGRSLVCQRKMSVWVRSVGRRGLCRTSTVPESMLSM